MVVAARQGLPRLEAQVAVGVDSAFLMVSCRL